MPLVNGVAPALGAVSGFMSLTDAVGGLGPSDTPINDALLSFGGSTMNFIFFNDFNAVDPDGFLIDAEPGLEGDYSGG